ncbi:MAG: DoxX family membrane protein, partial [Gemmatimonadales bacterium]
ILVLILKIPTILTSPRVEVAWESLSELVVLLTAALVLAAPGKRGVRIAQLAFGAALIPFGLSHFFYLKMTAPLIPKWIPHHTALAYLTGAAHLAAGVGVLAGVCARLAASMEALMLALFTVIVWLPQVAATPASQGVLSEFAASWAMSAGAWVVATSIAKRKAGSAR